MDDDPVGISARTSPRTSRSWTSLGGCSHRASLTEPRAGTELSSQKLACSGDERPDLREIANEAWPTDVKSWLPARADIIAVFQRDPACHRYISHFMFFQGFRTYNAIGLHTGFG